MESALLASSLLSVALVVTFLVYRERSDSAQRLRESLQLVVRMSAKLACSARHISHLCDARIRRDLRSYSLLFCFVKITHKKNTTTATLWKRFTASAEFHPQLGAQLTAESRVLRQAKLPPALAPSPIQAATNRKLQRLAEEQLKRDNRLGLDTRAVIVIHNNQLIAEAYCPFIRAETRLLGWSMAKSLLAILWGRMETLGLADTEQHQLFPEWEDDRRREITLENLLQMCDGLAFTESYRPDSDVTRMLFGEYSPSRYALQRPLTHAPGTCFSYSSGTTNLLARWIHCQLGGTTKMMRFLQREIFEPLGMNGAILETDTDGIFVGSSYAFLTARDWGRLGTLLLNNGIASGRQVLSHNWIHRATSANGSNNEPRYGYQLWLNSGGDIPPRHPSLPADSYFMLGNREQKLMVAPGHNAVIARLGWSSSPYPVESRFGALLAALPE
ncbi:serine hydrolase [Microbulbifer bruguierae]|uniref:Serine hydrolase n=1 Tax=Microbulbifer bruguierae TaxID=3029061 RepID=A0ABY8NER0_9GAMM|nr:serine hydrolase [Microbulbifer bruguierae]WGL17170.1 serine hydrolase [Microbulbifer bruguierae]